jgi:anti-sigma regulatory factor (Ser/Thr protein kinase)
METEFAYTPEIQSIPRIRKDLERLARDWEIPETELKQLTLVIEELFSRIIWHIAEHEHDTPVRILVSRKGRELDIVIIDNGHPVNPLNITNVRPADPVSGDDRGMGLALIKAFSDSIDYRREEDRNRLHIRKTIRSNP